MANDIAGVLLHGFGFMFLFTAFQTSTVIEPSVLQSNETEGGLGDRGDEVGFNSVAIIYSIFTAANWVAPSIVALLGAKWTMALSGLSYVGFIAAIIHPIEGVIYALAALLGFCAGSLWTAQGKYLTMCSDKSTMGRNAGIFWAMMETSLVLGNAFVFFYLKGDTTNISMTERYIIYGVLTGCGVFGVSLFLCLRRKTETTDSNVQFSLSGGKEKSEPSPVLAAFYKAGNLLKTKEMLCISLFCFYTGLDLTFFSSVYDTAVGNSVLPPKFGPTLGKKYVPLTGLFIGVGEIVAGLLFGLLGKKFVRHGRDPIVVIGLISHIVCYFLVFTSIPSNAPFEEAHDLSKTPYPLLLGPNLYLAQCAAFLLGFGDACFNTQIYSIIMALYQEDSAPPFALYKFFQSLAAAAGFFYSSHLLLHYQLIILVFFAVIGASAFIHVEWNSKRYSGYTPIQ
ncbi:UNC93-like protein MFSD11 [Oscarella lobularis]|uniref:UNC93-like protein MFSD11 n=1 Tax=Oscarella lobularis TaxID=121494 RepID=UPI0033133990